MTDHVTAIIVYNPLDVSDRASHELEWGADWTLSDYLDGLPDGVHWGVCVNAEPVEADVWGTTRLSPGDYITIMPLPAGGGGGGKNVMRLVSMIAVALIAAYAAPIIGGYVAGMASETFTTLTLAEAATVGTVATAAAGVAIPTLGIMTINAQLPPVNA